MKDKIKYEKYWCPECNRKYIVSETENYDEALCSHCKTKLRKVKKESDDNGESK